MDETQSDTGDQRLLKIDIWNSSAYVSSTLSPYKGTFSLAVSGFHTGGSQIAVGAEKRKLGGLSDLPKDLVPCIRSPVAAFVASLYAKLYDSADMLHSHGSCRRDYAVFS